MFCANCGSKEDTNNKFCTSCGAAKDLVEVPSSVPKRRPNVMPKKSANNGLIIAVCCVLAVTVVAVIGIGIYFSLRDTTGLVGRWEITLQTSQGVRETVVLQFYRDGTGARRLYDLLGQVNEIANFKWHVSGDGLLVMSFWENGIYLEPVRLDFIVTGEELVIDGIAFNRRTSEVSYVFHPELMPPSAAVPPATLPTQTPVPAPFVAATPVPQEPVVPIVQAQTHLEVLVPTLAVSMDPIGSFDTASAEFARLVFQTLFRLDYDSFRPIPELATHYRFVDTQTLRITVREGVTFHNGDLLSAHDVAFSLNAAGTSAEMSPLFGMIETAVAHSESELTLYLGIPFAPILHHLAHPGASIVPMNHIGRVGRNAFAQSPVGSGAFEFVNIVVGEHYNLRRFNNYSGNLPTLETITFRVEPDPSVRLMRVSSGHADVAIGVAPFDLVAAEADSNVTLMRRKTMGVDFIWMNTSRPHLNNPLVRQAINYAFDTEAVVNLVFHGLGEASHTALAPEVFGFSEQQPFTTDINRARELLMQAGYYPGGFNIEILWNIPNTQRQQMAYMLQHALRPLNINATVAGLEWGEYLHRIGAGEFDLIFLGRIAVTADADYGLYPMFHSGNFGAAGNFGFFHHPRLDALLEQGRAETNDARRLAVYSEALRIIRNYAPIMVLRSGEIAVAVNPNLSNVVLSPMLYHNWGTAFIASRDVDTRMDTGALVTEEPPMILTAVYLFISTFVGWPEVSAPGIGTNLYAIPVNFPHDAPSANPNLLGIVPNNDYVWPTGEWFRFYFDCGTIEIWKIVEGSIGRDGGGIVDRGIIRSSHLIAPETRRQILPGPGITNRIWGNY